MNLPVKIEIEVEGRWVILAEETDVKSATSYMEFVEEYMPNFVGDLQKCGWNGPALGQFRVRDTSAAGDESV